jgi:hypothetical protein
MYTVAMCMPLGVIPWPGWPHRLFGAEAARSV